MQTAREQDYYPLPADFGVVRHLALDDREACGLWRKILVIPPDKMMRLRGETGEVLGQPTQAAILMINGNPHLVFHPTPDDIYNIEAVYEPHLKTL